MDFSRNSFFIPEEIQKKLSQIDILLCGVGMGSVVAESLVRLGVCNLIIADGDIVELSNLNRQNFTSNDLNEQKVNSLEKRLLSINPKLKLKIVNKFLVKTDLQALILTVDFVINTIDFDQPAFLECHTLCKKYKKYELFPINLGFGGCLILNTQSSPSWDDYYKSSDHNKIKMMILNDVVINNSFSEKMLIKFNEYKTSPPEHDPQLHSASLSCSILITTTIVSILLGENIKTFPDTISFDPLSIIK
ncbi:ThiF family adenylyltransferase [Flammeovirga agarivorans]|uniref:ThiF family adenylyltransferase n=1 Tax=Flammeovirga agarivorans TaxID=2726742 RepID=A0A7X8SJ59_9BACT|nr:ThiF family adenylyltransferase [Flammeovirga agarivorans]NLR91224.1 ThiF family adenylyltransferase [Flammeovirga agarivorans]